MSSSLKTTLTPALMLGAITIATSCAMRAISFFCSGDRPVVPMTADTPCSRHSFKCAIVPSGRVKSISTCAPARPCHTSLVTRTPLLVPRKIAASCPRLGLPATSSAPLRRQSSARTTASISMCPMRPEAPATATASGGTVVNSTPARRIGAHRTGLGFRRGGGLLRRHRQRRTLLGCQLKGDHFASGRGAADLRDEFALRRQIGSLDVQQLVTLEASHHATPLRLRARALDREDVVPAVGMERVGQQGRAQQIAHLHRLIPGLASANCSLVTTLPWTMSMR